MRTFVLILLTGLFACRPELKQQSAEAQNSGKSFSEDSLAIAGVLHRQQEAWNRGSIDDFMHGYWKSDSLRFIGKKGIRYGYDSVAAAYKRHYDSPVKMGALEFSGLQIAGLDKDRTIANVTGHWNISGQDSAGGFFSLIFHKRNGRWLITTDHTW